MLEQLKRLVREVEGVALVELEVIRAGCKDHRGDVFPRQSEADRRPQCAFGRILRSAVDEAAEPVDIAFGTRLTRIERLEVEVRPLVLRRLGNVDYALI